MHNIYIYNLYPLLPNKMAVVFNIFIWNTINIFILHLVLDDNASNS